MNGYDKSVIEKKPWKSEFMYMYDLALDIYTKGSYVLFMVFATLLPVISVILMFRGDYTKSVLSMLFGLAFAYLLRLYQRN